MRSIRRSLALDTGLQSRATLDLREALALCGLLVVALGLRLFRLGDIDFMSDEIISRFVALAPPATIFGSITAMDTHPPLYHILLHYWGALFGYDLVPLRLMSAALGMLCVPAAWQLGRTLFGPQAGLLAATLIALSPFQILHSQQARMYPLLTLLVLLATLAFLAAWRHGGVWRWALLSLVATAGFYTHVYFAFSLLGLNLWALTESVRLRRLEWGRWIGLILAQLVAVLIFSPFLLSMFTLTSGVVSSFWIPPINPLAWLFTLATLLNYATFRLSSPPIWYLLLVYLPALCAVMFGLAYAVLRLRRQPDERTSWSLLLWAVVTPCAVAMLISLTLRPILLDRSLIGVSGPLLVLLAGAVVGTWSHRLTQGLMATLVLSIGIMLTAVYPSAPQPHTLQASIDTIFAERQPGDAVIVMDWESFDLVALRYPEAQDVYVAGSPERTAAWQERMRLMGWHTPDQVGLPAAYAGRHSRLWVLHTVFIYPSDWDPVYGWLQANLNLVSRRDGEKTTVLLYESTGATP